MDNLTQQTPPSTENTNNSVAPNLPSKKTPALALFIVVIFNFLLLGHLLLVIFVSVNDIRIPEKTGVLSGTNNVEISSPSKLVLPMPPTDSRVSNFNLLYIYVTTIRGIRDIGNGLELLTDVKANGAPFIIKPDASVRFFHGVDKESTPARMKDLKVGEQIKILQHYIFDGTDYTIETRFVLIDRSDGGIRELPLQKK